MAKDDPEIGIAAGLDIPTASALSEDDEPRPRRGCGWGLLLGSLGVLVVWWLLR